MINEDAIRNALKGGLQEMNCVDLMKPITKWCERVTEPQRVFWVMRRAFSLALNGQPGPVYIDIPKDLGLQEVRSGTYFPAEYPLRTSADPRRLQQADSLLRKAQRPIIVSSNGVAIASRQPARSCGSASAATSGIARPLKPIPVWYHGTPKSRLTPPPAPYNQPVRTQARVVVLQL